MDVMFLYILKMILLHIIITYYLYVLHYILHYVIIITFTLFNIISNMLILTKFLGIQKLFGTCCSFSDLVKKAKILNYLFFNYLKGDKKSLSSQILFCILCTIF